MDEFELLERLIQIGWRGSRDVLLGPGDDAAVLRGGLVISTDMVVEDVHFRFDWISAEEVGFRAGAAALSDMAAMAAEPKAMLVSLAVPHADGKPMDIQRGLAAAGDRVSVPIVGGDVSRSPGLVVVDVVAVGKVRAPVSRGGAEAGDELWLSGQIGGAAWAVGEWRGGRTPPDVARRAFARPPDRTRLGAALGNRGIAKAMIDLSDGLGADLGRMASRSGVRAVIIPDQVPLVDGTPEGLNMALGGGEDYELLFAAKAGAEAQIAELAAELHVPITRIGHLEKGEGVELEQPGGRTPVSPSTGHDHFESPNA